MNAFNFFNRPTAASSTTTTTTATTNNNSNADPYDDRAPLSPRLNPSDNHTIQGSYSSDSDDLEAGLAAPPAAATNTPEMAERRTPNTRFLHRFRPAIPSFFSSVSSSTRRHQHQEQEHQEPLYGFSIRPSSSHYSGVGLRGAPDTVIDGGGADPETPKSPEFRIGDRDLRLPGTRLHLPNLDRTWTQGSNGPPTRPGTAGVAVPEPAVLRSRARSRSEGGGGHAGSSSGDDEDDGTGTDRAQHRERMRRRRRRRREGERSGSGRSRRSERSGRSGRSGRSRRSGRSERSGSHRSSRDDESRSERRARRERRRRAEGSSASSPSSSRGSRSSGRRPPPKHFLFCFPWIKSRRVRSQILRCFVSGTFLALTLSIYLSLSLTKHVTSNEFTILLILILLFVAIFFCHSLVRLGMLVLKARKRNQMVERGQISAVIAPGGYAIPREPIPVVLARDEEAAGIESEATKTGPPAYGVWRESVRVDPDRLYWVRNEHAPPLDEVSELSGPDGSGPDGSTASSQSGARTQIPRPPSYSSDDGVSYVVDARPRSIAPPTPANTAPGGLPHPSQTGMSGTWV